MASLLDISLLSTFSNVFVILFIFVAVYGILMFKQPIGGNKGINALMAASVAFIFIFSQDAIEIVKDTIPWYVIMMIGLIFVLMITQSFGATMSNTVISNLGTWILIISIFILLTSISMRIGQRAGPFLSNETVDPNQVIAGQSGDVASGSFSQNFGATLFHPKVLALILIVAVTAFSVIWIGYVS